ncbi:TetR/AcrR family transcriptional regulator [Mycolicibacterium sp.]|uniref:TetR/AcrR family transcriptional regulator n=1 Tax=Mycolicibacterium sp. TaxID=2320850 RepID=UPI0037C666AC
MPDRQRERADRILDIAADLLLRWGYRRIRIDEVAKRAGVGKGTVYLHWRSREQMLAAVAARETARMIDAVVEGLRSDAGEVVPHRLMRRIFLEAMSRPVLRAIYTRDVDTVDALAGESSQVSAQSANFVAWQEYLRIAHDQGLLRDGLRPADAHYPLTAMTFGFFAVEPLLPAEVDLSLEAKADQLAESVRRVFEPARPPGRDHLDAAAAAAVALYERAAGEYRAVTYGTREGHHDEQN